jgi:hypothetical protein
MKLSSALFGILLLAPLLAACETQVPARNFPEISFAHEQPINLDVAQIQVESASPAAAPANGTIVHELPVNLSTVAEQWARQRLKAVGQSGTAIVRIEKATVVEEKLKKTDGFRGMFTTDQTERYVGDVEMSVSILDDRGQAMARGSATRSRTIAEGVTLAAREKLWFELVEQLAREIDTVMEKEIRQYLAAYLR